MYFANPWGLLGLLAMPAIVAIHMYHRRFPPMIVAGLHLWGAETQTRTAGRRLERLPITSTLLLELLAALLLSLVLSRPQWGDANSAVHLVVVLDNSASMSATTMQGKSFRDTVVEKLEERVETLSRGSVLTIILTGRRPVMLSGPRASWSVAKQQLDNWQPSANEHDFQPAWDLAGQLAEESGRLLFFTDQLPNADVPMPKLMEIVSVGRPGENVAVSTARWTFDSTTGKGDVFLRVENYGTQTANVTVLGRTDGEDIFRRTLSVNANSSVALETEVPGGLGRLNIEVRSAGDRLGLDNTVTLIEPKVRMLNVTVNLPNNHPALRPIQRVLAGMPDLNLEVGDSEAAHLVIASAEPLPASQGNLWWLGVGPLDLSEQAREEAKDLIGPFLLEKRNPLIDGMVLGGVIWGGVQPVELDVNPIISAGKFPLLAQLKGTQTTAYLLNIDLSRPNLTDSPDWPILIKNLIDLRRDNLPGLRRWNYRLNEEIRFRLFEGTRNLGGETAQELSLRHEGKSRPLARSSIVEVPPLPNPGIYEVFDGDNLLGEFSVNFHDPEESKLIGLNSANREPTVETTANETRLDNFYSWIILLCLFLILAAVLLDWKVLFGRKQHRAI
jgi:hypothetical protein